MNTVVTHEATLDDGAPLVLVARTTVLIIVGDPRVVLADRLEDIASTAGKLMADRDLAPAAIIDILAPYMDQLIAGADASSTIGHAAA
ncbi:hypothetical protein [Kitasatospora sp. NPDC006786]|uniref:hypothetical protein n=1 Tax=unclassified Kitasatospora TaxID=2633591 RepID=UPI0033DA1CE3